MDQKLYTQLLEKMADGFEALPDKPEETAQSTIRSLWLTASGNPTSAEGAGKVTLPPLSKAQEERLVTFVNKRKTGTPLSHLTGRQHFFGIEMLASAAALVPRKETEILASAAWEALDSLESDNPIIIDICTGCGNLAVALASQKPGCQVFASDLSQEAVTLASKNVSFLNLQDRVEVRQGDLLAPFDEERFLGKTHLLTCNPPYISSAKVKEMPQEISAFEPSVAFDGGPFGIKILQRLIKEAPRFLRAGGFLAFEVGLGQGEAMVKRLQKSPLFASVTPYRDKEENIRAIVARSADAVGL